MKEINKAISGVGKMIAVFVFVGENCLQTEAAVCCVTLFVLSHKILQFFAINFFSIKFSASNFLNHYFN